ncbi:hypothetical protein [Motilibacter deserti]|uniref:Uncharacterized protein n=1 Tax=Motilibacter deserti TaxID=2714956 RepID=A0ABX0GT47_9ACTN|nr:hypothetical protein [Motilibacter deserti]NHC13688.1 hypothetical protein [Motilibacter deserti]
MALSTAATTYIRVERSRDGTYAADLSTDLDALCEGMEYGDVCEGEYEVWVHPGGELCAVVPDRAVAERDHWATPRADLWLPELRVVGSDPARVAEAYEQLTRRR